MGLTPFYDFMNKKHSLGQVHIDMSHYNQFVHSFYYIRVCVPLAVYSIPVYNPINMMSLCLFGKTLLLYIGYIQVAFLFCFSAENQIKAGQLNVMQELVEVMLVHKADPRFAEKAAGALWNICMNGD